MKESASEKALQAVKTLQAEKLIRAVLIILVTAVACISLSACSREIRGPRDEITMYSWRAELEGGGDAELVFGDDYASFTAECGDHTLNVSGYCLIDDESFVICDSDTRSNYSFSYILHGDSIELTYGGGTITLLKIS